MVRLQFWSSGQYPIMSITLRSTFIWSGSKSKVGNRNRGQLLHQGVGEGTTPFPRLLHFTLDPYIIMLSVKLGSIKYHFFESLV